MQKNQQCSQTFNNSAINQSSIIAQALRMNRYQFPQIRSPNICLILVKCKLFVNNKLLCQIAQERKRREQERNKQEEKELKQLMPEIDDYHKYINNFKLMGQCKCGTVCYQKEEITSLKISSHSIQISIKQNKNYQGKTSNQIEPPNQKDLESGILKNSITSKISIQELSKNLIQTQARMPDQVIDALKSSERKTLPSYFNCRMELNMKEMDLENRYGQMDQYMKENENKINLMGMVD
ncbi:unnamed protein product (macronuclear) [Paramecium tetraurelia]|uniref:Uncharacterized protein n=1 Tax=Paramecium tetraurelia TaxID=5888 RepID=A0C7Y0_PARTE|nr:uncharacterized protein GSPATT00036028001 [Paramecium tetraurelia]CAK66897.1 unnamed protein product [Paramecium tetraurelia]|eukprot:XP_001434294.1 hypothetical protein (macronuclear) [Paramecium tetraurelia strain d4-2]